MLTAACAQVWLPPAAVLQRWPPAHAHHCWQVELLPFADFVHSAHAVVQAGGDADCRPRGAAGERAPASRLTTSLGRYVLSAVWPGKACSGRSTARIGAPLDANILGGCFFLQLLVNGCLGDSIASSDRALLALTPIARCSAELSGPVAASAAAIPSAA